jgi:hypothetical protein
MPTAILRYSTTGGFVVGADGKTCDLIEHTTLSANTQKVFQIPDLPAAYALYGEIGIGDGEPETPLILDLSSSVKRIVGSRTAAPTDLLMYANNLAHEIHGFLVDAKERGAIFHGFGDAYPNGTGIARILLFGYFEGVPSEAHILFSHRDQVPMQKVSRVDLRRSNPEVLGSAVIEQRLLRQLRSEDINVLEAAE